MIRTKEHNQKISDAMKDKKKSEEHRKRISDSMKGNQNARKKVILSE